MPWLRFTRRFDWKPAGEQVVIVHQADDVRLVTSACAEAALVAGAAETTTKPKMEASNASRPAK